jgi:hypothetical protein
VRESSGLHEQIVELARPPVARERVSLVDESLSMIVSGQDF